MSKGKKKRLFESKREVFKTKRTSGKSKKKSRKKKLVATPQLAKLPGMRKRQVVKTSSGVGPKNDYSYTQNREESWLRFDARVLDEALDETVPLFERLKFVSIFGSNLDEWFMVRIGGLSDLSLLKRQPRDTRSGMTPSEQIENALSMLPELIDRQGAAFTALEANLAGAGLTRVHASDLTDADLRKVARHFETRIAPIISPMIVDPRHPFPNLKNGRLYVACSLDGPDEEGLLGVVEVPHSLDRVVELPSTPHNYRYILIEDVILSRLAECFGVYQPTSSAVVRVTRNADVDPDGDGIAEDSDYRDHMKKVLKKRLRLQAVRLEVEGSLDSSLEDFVIGSLRLTDTHVFHTSIPLDLGYVFSLEDKAAAVSNGKLLYEPFEPQPSPIVDPKRPMREQVEERDILLTYPYQSMSPLLHLLREASSDAACISIKVTLYRVARQSKLCESLIAAVENGKEVTVLMELRARFDEANNIAWAERLETAGCTVIYGSEGFKCHSKICQITYHDDGEIRRITCLGTGNFNEKTARLYSDFMLLTAHPGIGEDGNTFFRNLSLGNLYGTYRYLGVAPVGLKPLVMRGLDREIGRARAGEPSFVFMKMNSLTDRDVIDKIAEACQAGVPVVLIVRGITCIRANVPGKTEGLLMRQIVGRFLEHARIYAFGSEADTLYLSSADMMTRNTEHRVEIAYPVLDENCRRSVVRFINLQLADNAKARQLANDGTWERVIPQLGEPVINSQELLLALTEREALEPVGDVLASLIPCSSVEVRLSSDTLRRIVSIPSTDVVPIADPHSYHEPTRVAEEFAADETETSAAEAPSEVQGTTEGVVEPVAAPEPEPTVAPEPEPIPEPEPEPEPIPEPVLSAESIPEAVAEPEPKVEPVVELEPEPTVQVNTTDVVEAQPEDAPAAEAIDETPSANLADVDDAQLPSEALGSTDVTDESATEANAEPEASAQPEENVEPTEEPSADPESEIPASAQENLAEEPLPEAIGQTESEASGEDEPAPASTDDAATSAAAPAEPERVEAHIIPNKSANNESSSQDAPSKKKTSLAKRQPGRFSMGMALIAAGVKTLFTGRYPGKKGKKNKR